MRATVFDCLLVCLFTCLFLPPLINNNLGLHFQHGWMVKMEVNGLFVFYVYHDAVNNWSNIPRSPNMRGE